MSAKATRDAYGEWLIESGRKDQRIVVVDADLSESTKTIGFGKEFRNRFFDVGVAEQNLVAMSAGLSLAGKRVFASSFAIFETGRAWEQIRNFVAHDSLNVALVASHAGLSSAADGSSHQALEDVAIMRVLPNMRVIQPCDAEETKHALDVILASEGPFYMRLRREKETIIQKPYTFKLGRAEVLRDGGDVSLFASGTTVSASLQAAELLKARGVDAEVINIHTIKPLDAETLVKSAAKTGAVVTIEEHNIIGGLGGAVSEVLSEQKPTLMLRIGIPDTFGSSSRTIEALYRAFGLMPDQIAEAANTFIMKARNMM
jgi:transketolase